MLVLIVAGFLYFKDGCSGMMQNISSFATGGVLDPRVRQSTCLRGPDETKNTLPEAVSLLKFAPAPGDQGQQGSCVAWSSAYGARTILEASSAGFNPNQTAFSPSFMYNQIGLDGCQVAISSGQWKTLPKLALFPWTNFPTMTRIAAGSPFIK